VIGNPTHGSGSVRSRPSYKRSAPKVIGKSHPRQWVGSFKSNLQEERPQSDWKSHPRQWVGSFMSNLQRAAPQRV